MLLVTLVKQVIREGNILIVFFIARGWTNKFNLWEIRIPLITLVKVTLAGGIKF